jgi:amidohydrolase
MAEGCGAIADISFTLGVGPVYNDPELTKIMSQSLSEVAGSAGISVSNPITVGDDFSAFTEQVPGFYFLLGILPQGLDPYKHINHSPYFIVDDAALHMGVKALSYLTTNYLSER